MGSLLYVNSGQFNLVHVIDMSEDGDTLQGINSERNFESV